MRSGTQENWPALPENVMAILRCTSCQSRLAQQEEALVCTNCARIYPFVKGIVRFVDKEHYAGSFGFQWHRFATTQIDTPQSVRSEQDFQRRTGLTPQDLNGKLVLDVGCGMGRFAEVATRWG